MSVPRHQQLIDAIDTGNPETARAAVDLHMRGAAQNLLNDGRVAGAHRLITARPLRGDPNQRSRWTRA